MRDMQLQERKDRITGGEPVSGRRTFLDFSCGFGYNKRQKMTGCTGHP